MTTRQEFRDGSLRSLLASQTVFPDSLLNAWIDEAVRDYSLHFPRQISKTLEALAAGQREFSYASLGSPEAVYAITRVEYPLGAVPRSFLQRLPRDHPAFEGGRYYDLVNDGAIEVGMSLQAGESLGVLYLTHHLVPASDITSLTVPDDHLEALKLYVVLQAVRKLEMDQAANPEQASLLLSMLGANASRAARLYQAQIRLYRQAAGQGAFTGPWSMDRWDRAY